MHCRGVFVVHGSETALMKIPEEWGRASRFRKSRIGVGDSAILDYVQDFWEVCILGEVLYNPGFI
jgi:hypothetical protein